MIKADGPTLHGRSGAVRNRPVLGRLKRLCIQSAGGESLFAMQNHIAQAGNTVVPALLAIESLGFTVEVGDRVVTARSEDAEFVAGDPVAVLGLIHLVELRSWAWTARDDEIDAVLRRHGLA